jgi:CubicO group peptidase (beta-lactamase class C family)
MYSGTQIHNESEIGAALELLNAQVHADVAAHIVPGLSAAVVQGQETIWAHGFGYANLEQHIPAEPDTVYAVGSITKLFTATMLMQLRDARKLRLDDPVQDYLPDIRVPRRHTGAPAITFRHLVTHTAGLVKDAPVGYWDTREFPPVETLMQSLAEAEQPYPPGAQWKYSNLGLALLGYALAQIAGQSWEEYVQEHVLHSLGMTNTAPRLTERLRPKVATGYARPVAGWPPAVLPHLDLGGLGSAGSLHSTVTDMAKFIAEQFAPQPKLLQRHTIEEMHRVQWLNPDWTQGQAIGWRLQRTSDGTTRIEHGGGVYGFTCRVALSPADQLGVAVFTNGSDGNVGLTIATQALDLLVPVARHVAARRSVTLPAAVPARWEPYVGRYRWVLSDMEVVTQEDRLVLRLPNGPVVEEVPLQAEAEHVFWMPTGTMRGERLRFVVGSAGQVTGAWVGPHPYDRI